MTEDWISLIFSVLTGVSQTYKYSFVFLFSPLPDPCHLLTDKQMRGFHNHINAFYVSIDKNCKVNIKMFKLNSVNALTCGLLYP